MQARIVEKGISAESIAVLPPWPHDDDIHYDDAGRAAFRMRHGLTDKFVVMYSGNHSSCHPLDTLLTAALRLQAEGNIVFCFVGGSSASFKRSKTSHGTSSNIVCLPYQPRSELSGSLSAADLHVVVMRDRFNGLVHPCKIYNIVAIGAPLLYIGPEESHVTDLLQQHTSGISARSARHGAVEQVVAHIQAAAAAGPVRTKSIQEVTAHFSSHTLLPRMISMFEHLENGTALCTRTALTAPAAERRPRSSSAET